MQLRRSGRSMAPAEPAALATSVADDSPPSTSSAPSKSKKRASLSASRHPSSPALPTKHAQAPAKGKRKPAAVTVAEAVTEPAVEAEDEDHAEPKAKRRKGASASDASGCTRQLEKQMHSQGFPCVGGVDEAGRGPLCGPVVAACVVLPPNLDIPGINDSKQLSEAQREALYEIITITPGVQWAVQVVDHITIDRVNILQATMLAMKGAVEQIPQGKLDYILIDGNRLPKDLPAPAKAVVKGDTKHVCIAAASILAKVTRDRLMIALDKQYPLYHLASHKGYGVPAHVAAIKQHGPCPAHRRSFQPIRGITGWTREAQLEQEAKQ